MPGRDRKISKNDAIAMEMQPVTPEMLKQALKEALEEVLQEKRAFLRDLIEEVLEDVALSRAIQEGLESEEVSRQQIFDLLKGGDA
jgi:hypothetical protein